MENWKKFAAQKIDELGYHDEGCATRDELADEDTNCDCGSSKDLMSLCESVVGFVVTELKNN